MDIGIGLPSAIPGTSPNQVLEWAVRAEELGFSTLGTLDRIVYDNYEPLVTLAAAAAVTTRVGLTTTILLAPLRTNVALLAKQVASVDALSGGRLALGLALGGREDDYTASRVPKQGRGTRLTHQIKELREIWAGEKRGYAGGIGPSAGANGGPPILVGGSTPPALARAAKLGDGWIMGGGPPDQFRELAGQFEAAWEAAGRAARPRKLSLSRYALGSNARESADSYLLDFYGWLGENAKPIAAGTAVDASGIRARIDAFREAGCDELIFFPCSAGLEQVELLAEALR